MMIAHLLVNQSITKTVPARCFENLPVVLRTIPVFGDWQPAPGVFSYICIIMKQSSPSRITPAHISELVPGEIFVFGSNCRGAHMGGAARVAMERFGAVWGVGEGLQGQSYAISTMEGLDNLRPAVERFAAFAKAHPEQRFLVTPIGCGIAGYTPEQIAPFFRKASALPNVTLPDSFWEVL